MDEGRLPTALWVETQLRLLDSRNIAFYIVNKGAGGSGVVALKINGLGQGFRLFIQQRDLDGFLGWVSPLASENPGEAEIDAYLERSIKRDPDLWVIEVENRTLENPFI